MSDGHDRAWVRFCSTFNAFRASYGAWPTTVRCDPTGLQLIREQLLDEPSLTILDAAFDLISCREGHGRGSRPGGTPNRLRTGGAIDDRPGHARASPPACHAPPLRALAA